MRDERDIIIAEEYESTHPAYNSSLNQDDSDIPEHKYSLRVSIFIKLLAINHIFYVYP